MGNEALPFEPESNASLRARLPKAISKLWIFPKVSEEEILKMERPGQTRECVFDFECGLRLIISKDQLEGENEPPRIHISASAFKRIFEHLNTLEELTKFIQDYYELINGKGTLKFIGISKGMVPHWIVDIEH